MSNIKNAVVAAKDGKFTEFEDCIKTEILDRVDTHPRIVAHDKVVSDFSKQKDAYAEIK